MSEIDAKIDEFSPEFRPLATRLRELIHEEVPTVEEAVKWGKPNFSVDGTGLFYIAATQKHVKFGLFEGAELPDPTGIVEGTGKKMRHVKIADEEDLDESAVRGLIRAATANAEA